MAQQALGREHDERQRVGVEQQRLTAQHVEVLGRGGAVDDAHVQIGGQLQEAFDARARVIRALAFVAVRQQQHERRSHAPLGAARHQVLVENRLRAIDEVAVLRLPQHESLRLLEVVAELEANHGQLRQRAVVDLEGRLRLGQHLQGRVAGAGDRVVQHRVTVAERAALHVFAGEANGDALGQHRRHGEFFGGGPVDRAFVGRGEHGALALATALQLLVHREAGRHLRERLGDGFELRQRHRGVHAGSGAARRHHRHLGHVVRLGLQAGIRLFHCGRMFGHELVGHRRWHLARGHERGRVLMTHRGMCGDALIEQGLRERRFVAFVVAVTPVAHQVDEEVELETVAIGPRQPRRLDARHRVVGVDVHDRHLEAARQAAGVAGRVRLVRFGREPELVVGDQMNRAAHVPAGQPREIQRLGHDALAGERGIAVDQDAEHLVGTQRRGARRVDRRGGGA